ncbi:MAG: class I SAM-dependent methyltransferase [Gammaproteobacteria bacterium]|nr:MAG: class I SAM-dependent methyltransferase [Gammaproteobacteria bacterium]|tara:strand:+ start:267 stop:980 length:714 start_codon:yes stop_codon:yes gene_type:complete
MQTIDLKKMQLKPNSKFLDLGCGEGRHCFGAYMSEEIDVFGFDMSLSDVGKAKENFDQFNENTSTKSCNFGVADAKKLPFKDNTFDFIICSEVLEHIIDYQSALSEINRILKPEGKLAVSVPKFFPEWICWKLSIDYQNTPGGHVRIFKFKELKKDIADYGLHFSQRHWAHALHSPYWWLQCLFWNSKENSKIINLYHEFLVWDMMKKPFLTKCLEYIFQPLIGKSVVLYFNKDKKA